MLRMLLLLLASVLGRGSASIPDVNCLVINLQHINCIWDHENRSELNHTFQSRLGSAGHYRDCPWYLLENGYNVGCRLPYNKGDKFLSLYTRLTNDNVTKEKTIDLKEEVKLNPPFNLSVEVNNVSLELWLYWNVSTPSTCLESEVQYRKDKNKWNSVNISGSSTSYSLPQVSLKHQYELQVRTRVPIKCGQSKFWSDWSIPVFWGNTTDVSPVAWKGFYFIMATGTMVLLAILVALLVYGERIIFVPVVPNPGKNLEDLFKTCNGNVEEWLHISKEFKEGFQPNYSEPTCPVRECPALSETTEHGPVQTGQSECPAVSFSLPGSLPTLKNVPPGLV